MTPVIPLAPVVGALAFATLPAAALAHVSAQPSVAYAGAYQALRFQVGHGCADRYATTALTIAAPADVRVFRPQPKPGWTLSIDKAADGRVTAVTWRGRLEADQFDDFAVLIQAPNAIEPLLFPAIQGCETGENRWVDPPPAMGDKPSATPAPLVNILAAPAATESHNHAQ